MSRERGGASGARAADRRPGTPSDERSVMPHAGGAAPLDLYSRFWVDAASYWADAWQRGVLYLDVMRRRGNQYHEHMAQKAPHVLSFAGELVADRRELERPVNYGLVRIAPPVGVLVDEAKRPFVVVGPRAGHGPGI